MSNRLIVAANIMSSAAMRATRVLLGLPADDLDCRLRALALNEARQILSAVEEHIKKPSNPRIVGGYVIGENVSLLGKARAMLEIANR